MTQPVQPSPRLLRDQLLLILRTISKVQCVWATRKQPHLGQQDPEISNERAWIKASLQSWQSIGIDEQRQQYNPVTDQNDTLVVGQRRFTLVVRAESNDPKLEAFDLCERVRFRFRSQTARALMVPVLALIDFGPIVTHQAFADVGGTKREMLAATLDVRMAGVVADDPLDPGEGGYIATVDAATGGLIPGTLLP